MFVTIDFFDHMDLFTSTWKSLVVSGAYLLLKLPSYVQLILPLAFLISMLILLIIMVRENEMIVVRTSGISTASLMKTLLAFSVVLVLISFLLAEWIIPVTSHISDYLLQVKIRGNAHVFFKNDKIWFKRDNVIGNIDSFDTKKDIIRGMTIIELSRTFNIEKRYEAKEGFFKDGEWYFKNVSRWIFNEKGIVSRQIFEEMTGLLNEPPSVFKTADKDPEEMGYRDLSRYIDRLKKDGHDVRRYLVDLYNKIAFPFVNLIMVFMAFSVGLRYVKTKHISKAIFSGVLLGGLYWVILSVSLSLGYAEIFPPLFAAWFPNCLFVASGVIGIMTLRT